MSLKAPIPNEVFLSLNLKAINNKEVKLDISNNILIKEEKLAAKNTIKKYRLQIGAFRKISNAQSFLENLDIIDYFKIYAKNIFWNNLFAFASN